MRDGSNKLTSFSVIKIYDFESFFYVMAYIL